MSIEKKIHYCWFGRNPKSELIDKCIATWHNQLPDYQVIEWNEDNFDIAMSTYTEAAYRHKKYAFVSDFARFHILHHHGGIYLDVDVEVKKSLDPFLQHRCFMGFESERFVNPGLIVGAEQGHPAIKDIYDSYKGRQFYYSDKVLNQTTVVEVTTRYLARHGLQRNNTRQTINGVDVYPKTYFSPIAYDSDDKDFTDCTHTVHHFAGSWISETDKVVNHTQQSKFKKRMNEYIKASIVTCFGEHQFYQLKKMLKG